MEEEFKTGDCIRVRIEDVAFGGDGVGRVSDRVLFVPFTVDGDEAEVEITEVRKRYARAKPIGIPVPSRHRVRPLCPVYTRCGGCGMQHIAYPHQLALKQRQVEETFRRIAGLSRIPIAEIIPSPRPFGWRGKAEFHLAGGRKGHYRAGLMGGKSHELIEIESCGVVEASVNVKYDDFRKALRSRQVRPSGKRQVIWSDEPSESPTAVFTGPGAPPDVIRVVRGRRLTVPGRGFFQANVALVGELVDRVVDMCGLTGREAVIDAFAGSGLFSLFLGPKAAALTGIEGDREAVRCARINLNRERIPQAGFLHGDVNVLLRNEFLDRRRTANIILFDPPREGCSNGALDAAASLHPDRIVYVSCNPATQARDVRFLTGCGYVLRKLQPLDMFPQTAHVEVVALLTPAGTGGAAVASSDACGETAISDSDFRVP